MIEQTNDLSIIASIKNLFKSQKKNFWDESTEEQREEIEESDRTIERGNFLDFDDFIKKYI